jgi:hypothetical protein
MYHPVFVSFVELQAARGYRFEVAIPHGQAISGIIYLDTR